MMIHPVITMLSLYSAEGDICVKSPVVSLPDVCLKPNLSLNSIK